MQQLAGTQLRSSFFYGTILTHTVYNELIAKARRIQSWARIKKPKQ
jgi:hypothetical protein